eukprot:TRINITY_DN11486_c0_g1_i1.p1 TRINITY_DN11486_c0_g1~~TRINITY_DN11486_c0_g1_i1.p1  ORF type:complete len:322 (+),score=68.75 TRINITY_DN11486_c0_g1_i1:46-966(+)
MPDIPFNASMMPVFDARLKQLDQFLIQRARDIDDVLIPWDPAVVDHSDLIVAANDMKKLLEKWKKSTVQLLQGLWLEQRKRYEAYRKDVQDALWKRHMAELEALFSGYRFMPEGKDDKSTLSTAQQAVKQHLNEAGYRYDKDNLMLHKVGTRQVQERGLLGKITKKHHAVFAEGYKSDLAKLTKVINKVVDNGNRCIMLADQKITMSHQVSSTPSLYKRFQPAKEEAKSRNESVAPPLVQSQPDTNPHPPRGSGLDGNTRASRSSSNYPDKDPPANESEVGTTKEDESNKRMSTPSNAGEGIEGPE